MKSINIKLGNTKKNSSVKESGRYTAVIKQVVDIGMQPGFGDREPQHCMALVFGLKDGSTLVKKLTVSDHELSTLMEVVRAAGVMPTDEAGMVQTADLIGKSIAVEVDVQGAFARVTQVSTLESFDDEPITFKPSEDSLIENIESRLSDPNAKAFVMSLHPEVRRYLSNRIRQREV